MGKIKKEEIVKLPQSVWEKDYWNEWDYKAHEEDFKKIYGEYKNLRKIYDDDARMARWRWIESKGGLIMKSEKIGDKFVDIPYKKETYNYYANMFSKFDDWLYFKEQKENTPEQLQAMKNKIFEGVQKIDFSIPKSIRERANIEVQNVEDEMTKDALDNF